MIIARLGHQRAPNRTRLNTAVDLSVSPTDSVDVAMATIAATVIKLSFKEVMESVHKQNKTNKNIEGSAGTFDQPPTVKIDQPLHSQP